MVQASCAARLAPQVSLTAKSPITGIAVNFTDAPPLLITFRILAGLVEPTLCPPNFKFAGVINNAPGVAVEVGVAEGVAVAVGVVVAVAVAVGVVVAVAVAV